MLVGIKPDGVHVAAARQHGGLPFHGFLHGLNLITVQGRLLEFQCLRRLLHFLLQIFEELRGAPGKRIADFLYLFAVQAFVERARAGREALLHMIVQARPDAVLHGPVAATAQGKGPEQKLPRLPGRQS